MLKLPNFKQIDAQGIQSRLHAILADNRQKIAELLASTEDYTWHNLITPLQQLSETLEQFWAPISQLNAVNNTDAMRDAYNACLPALTDYSVWLGQHRGLYQAYHYIQQRYQDKLSAEQQQVLKQELRDFTLAGVGLDDEARARYQAISQRLSSLQTAFEENLIDNTDDWYYHITEQQQLSGLPSSAMESAKHKAEQKGLSGWLLGIDIPCYLAVITYADDRQLRELIYRAYNTRGSAEFAQAKYDNSQIIQDILCLRLEKAQLLGYANYADYSLATKMADSSTQVIDFLKQIAQPSKQKGQQEWQELRQFAKSLTNQTLQAWDIAYYSEKLKQQQFQIDSEALRAYFPLPKVLSGMFTIIERLYGITVTPKTDVDVWHPDVQFFNLHDQQGQLRGGFYIDLYARAKKRGGAWMADCVNRAQLGGELQLPIAFLNCNFLPPSDKQPALLTHDDVVTLFHECGHSLHHLLTQQIYPEISGINGVAWDAVELPSQFFENWCWDQQAITLLSEHYQTGEALPDVTLQQLIKVKNFHSALQSLRQVEFALYDMRLHKEFDANRDDQPQTVLQAVRDEVSLIKPPPWNRFQNSFSHIFAGGYAAGYYSYKWAEVLSADAFGAFIENGIFDQKTGRRFLQCILEKGGSREPQQLFIDFRGRDAQVGALLRQEGITT